MTRGLKKKNQTYLGNPLLRQLSGLLALDPQGRRSENQVSLVARLRPLQRGVDDGLVDPSHFMEQRRQVRAIDVEGVHGGVAVGEGLELINGKRARRFRGRGGIGRGCREAEGQFGGGHGEGSVVSEGLRGGGCEEVVMVG